MVAGWVLLGVSLVYVGLLFVVAYYGDRRPLYPERTWLRPIVYSLALAVYCSSWTFYGAVGTAVSSGWSYLPIYLGPVLLFVFAIGILRRLVQIAHEQNITSIADFLGARYGKSQGLAALATVIAVIAAVPYIALQFKAGAMSIDVMSGAGSGGGVFRDSAFYLAVLLAVFAILFGTRQVDATEHHHGLMLAVALESVVKLVAFVAVGAYAWFHLRGEAQPLFEASAFAQPDMPPDFLAQTLLAFLAMFCLPRQFQVGVVECENTRDLRPARWFFPLYLIVISALVVPIALAGIAKFGGTSVNPDTYVLMLPLANGNNALALVAYLGGFSAATGMVLVASVALATMVSNDLVMPALLRWRALRLDQQPDLSRIVLGVRRGTIVVLAIAAYGYYRATETQQNLASIGLLSFAAVAQFAPAIIGGLYWRGASRIGAIGGLVAGFAVWGYTLLLPTLANADWMSRTWVYLGPADIAWLRPQALFGLAGWNALTHGVFWSLLFNIGAYVFLSLRHRPGVDERLRALPFLDPWMRRPSNVGGEWHGRINVADLRAIAERIIGPRAVERAFDEYREVSARPLAPTDAADRGLLQYTERLLAAAIGGASARRMLTTALRGTGMDLGEVVSLLDEASQELRFNREMLGVTLENISQGVSVVDGGMCLVAWNRRYLEMFGYPDGMVYVGRPVADLIRWNAERGECGPGEVDEHVRKRIAYMRQGSPHVFERVRADGTVIEMRGQPMPGGGYVTTYTDVTAYKRVEQALIDANETLEQRVQDRTEELTAALDAQRRAKLEAEAANLSKTRFLAAASHDLLQPLNAARLFSSALNANPPDDPDTRQLAERIDSALKNAEELLDGLLDTSRLDSGALRPEPSDVSAARLCDSLQEQFAPLAEARGLALRVFCDEHLWLHSDRRLLRRILQNFLANALRYTRHGGVLLACRPRGSELEWQVWDTGGGIAPEHVGAVFEEFRRLDQPSPWGEQGLGLGLSICERLARMLGHPIGLRSRLGRGSVFTLRVPRVREPDMKPVPLPQPTRDVAGLRALCIDNDPAILDGMRALLQRWGVVVDTANGLETALVAARAHRPDVLLVDYHLGETLDGLAVLAIVQRELAPRSPPGALLTADGSDELARRARGDGYPLLQKPVRPAALRALLAALARRTSIAPEPVRSTPLPPGSLQAK
ncbi:PAS domain-containing hybrid sensor histidine kinase/response regulator [Chiayiivirga flava]|uniref:histidine kinase n=1 Tax=Chiayiivirga flava TaxID=659595 RepID=A0A7W8D6G3_9GAMM|nr:PAS domain-containing hybrid sensor histidine kinase/response regulator [Chiayiivirga flava]MBB5207675.1 Na+/proline symporter/signal transduction histidine kinase [Chiayiivirga flava]